MIPAITSCGPAAPTPAGAVTGQISTHLPQRVQASIISSVRTESADSKVISFMALAYRVPPRAARVRKNEKAAQKAAFLR